MKILVVEDQSRVGHFVEKALAEQNYSARIVGTCAAARDALSESPYGAVILDIGLPDGDGLDLLQEWRSAGFNEPVLILSVALGADDYLAKPFSVDELLARVRSLLRRHAGAKTSVLVHGSLQLDLMAHPVTRNGVRIDLTSREFSLLELFLQNPGRILTRSLIAEKVWEASYDMETNLIDVYVRRLRRKLEESPDRPLIKTIRGTGYELV